MPSEPTAVGIFDFDNHYYEAEDAFTRHADRSLRNRGVRWADIDGRRRLLVGGTLNSYIANPMFDPVAKPGALFDWYRGNPQRQGIVEAFGELEPIRPEYRDRDVRLKVMDEQGSTGRCCSRRSASASRTRWSTTRRRAPRSFEAFNRWLEDDWGYRVRGPHLRRAVHRARRAGRRGRRAAPGDRRRRGRRQRPRGPGRRAGRPPLAVRSRLRRDLGSGRGGRHRGRDARRHRRVRPARADVGAGRRGELAVPVAAARDRHEGPGRQRLLRRRAVPQGVRPVPGPALRERRERGVVGPRHAPPPRRRGQPEPRLLRRAPPRTVRRARLDHAVLGGRRRRPARRRARRPAAARIGLAPRRGHTANRPTSCPSRWSACPMPRCNRSLARTRSTSSRSRCPEPARLRCQDCLPARLAGARLVLGRRVGRGVRSRSPRASSPARRRGRTS